jgi:predicted phosphodiesterase
MRYAVLSDVHATIEALERVLDTAERAKVDRVLVLGDVVGYHTAPNECVERLQRADALCIAGNHDRAAAGLLPTGRMSATAELAIAWTRRVLDSEHTQWLATLPLTERVGMMFLFHAALTPEPDVELHLSTPRRVTKSLEALRRGAHGARIGFFGHTHRPAVHRLGPDGTTESTNAARVALDGESHYLINPGSVGQPRDGDARASFAIFDDEALVVEFHRVPFDFAGARRDAARLGLVHEPRGLERLKGRVVDFLGHGLGAVKRRLA